MRPRPLFRGMHVSNVYHQKAAACEESANKATKGWMGKRAECLRKGGKGHGLQPWRPLCLVIGKPVFGVHCRERLDQGRRNEKTLGPVLCACVI